MVSPSFFVGSHVIFSLSLEHSKLQIVDLAGCENHKHEATEDGRHINRSLFFLGEATRDVSKTI